MNNSRSSLDSGEIYFSMLLQSSLRTGFSLITQHPIRRLTTVLHLTSAEANILMSVSIRFPLEREPRDLRAELETVLLLCILFAFHQVSKQL